MIKFSLLGETILEWNDKDIEHYHARRMAMDSMLCRSKATYAAEVSSYTKGLGIFTVKPSGYQITKGGYSDNIRMNEIDKLLFMFQ